MIPPLHLVTDDEVLAGSGFVGRAGAALEAGGPRVCLHLRGPRTSGRALWERGRALLPLARRAGARMVVNDRVDVALLLGADGVHLPERGLPPGVARELLPPEALVGRSVHAPPPTTEGPDRPDYLFAGTLYRTPSHPDRPGAGPDRLRAVRAAAPGVPVIGIGGVTPERVAAVVAAGGAGVAVLRGVWHASDPAAAVERFVRELKAHLGEEEASR